MLRSPHADRRDVIELTPEVLRTWALPLDEDGDKHDRGTVVVIAGSAATAGAALLAGRAALRMGAGRLQIVTDESVAAPLSIAVPEAMVVGLPRQAVAGEGVGAIHELVEPLLEGAQALVVGPGLGSGSLPVDVLGRAAGLLPSSSPVVVDARALEALDRLDDEALDSLATRLILTPNRDELEGLAGLGDGDDADPMVTVARSRKAVVTSFGRIEAHDGRGWTVSCTVPGLGTSGSGDVLAGLVGGAAARCQDPAQVTCWATYVHAEVGRQLADVVGPASYLASDLVDAVARVMGELDTR